jgi:apolipoprotein N-acyltransferase
MEVATSGVSAVIAPDGSVVSKTGEYQAAFLDAQVRENTGRTLADRLGAWPEWVMALAGLLAAALAGPRGRALVRRTRFGAGSLPVAQSDENAIQNAAFENPTADPERDVPLASAAKGRAR